MSQDTGSDVAEITLEDEKKEIDPGSTVNELADEMGRDDVVGALINGVQADLRDRPEDGDTVQFLTFEDDEGKSTFWHTTAHVLAQAVKLYLDDDGPVSLGTGPPIEEGFYYDFDLPRSLSEGELDHIENIMRQIIQRDLPLERYYLDRKEAIEHLKEMDEPYKIELAEDLEEQPSFYRQNGFEDLCGGPHLLSTGDIGAISLTKLSGSFWKGNEDNPQMQRIYGISFPTDQELEQYERRLEEAKKRDTACEEASPFVTSGSRTTATPRRSSTTSPTARASATASAWFDFLSSRICSTVRSKVSVSFNELLYTFIYTT